MQGIRLPNQQNAGSAIQSTGWKKGDRVKITAGKYAGKSAQYIFGVRDGMINRFSSIIKLFR